MKPRHEKATELAYYMNLETGTLNESAFHWERTLYTKAVAKKALDKQILACTRCPSLNIPYMSSAAVGWGNLNADIFFIGKSLHEPGMKSGIPFILHSGDYLDMALHISGLTRYDVFVTNQCHCHPPRNRDCTDAEKVRCLPYLIAEFKIVRPKLLVTLGNDAKDAANEVEKAIDFDISRFHCVHPSNLMRNHTDTETIIDWVVKLSDRIDKVIE